MEDVIKDLSGLVPVSVTSLPHEKETTKPRACFFFGSTLVSSVQTVPVPKERRLSSLSEDFNSERRLDF